MSQENTHENHSFTIIVNGQEKTVTQKELTFMEVVALAYENIPTEENITYTVTFRRGEGNKPEGTLIEGGTLKIKDGMIINVTATNKS